jgi:hypothetical protein
MHVTSSVHATEGSLYTLLSQAPSLIALRPAPPHTSITTGALCTMHLLYMPLKAACWPTPCASTHRHRSSLRGSCPASCPSHSRCARRCCTRLPGHCGSACTSQGGSSHCSRHTHSSEARRAQRLDHTCMRMHEGLQVRATPREAHSFMPGCKEAVWCLMHTQALTALLCSVSSTAAALPQCMVAHAAAAAAAAAAAVHAYLPTGSHGLLQPPPQPPDQPLPAHGS